jgi:hypothetical protein
MADSEQVKSLLRYMPLPGRRGNVNWMDTLGDFASISGVLAGFNLTFVVFILGWSAQTQWGVSLFDGVTWGHVGVLFNGASAVLFIAAAEFLTTAKEYNVWALSDKYENYLQHVYPDWGRLRGQVWADCLRYEARGRRLYNFAIIFTFVAFFFVVGSYNLTIGAAVAMLGIAFESLQWFLVRKPRVQPSGKPSTPASLAPDPGG